MSSRLDLFLNHCTGFRFEKESTTNSHASAGMLSLRLVHNTWLTSYMSMCHPDNSALHLMTGFSDF